VELDFAREEDSMNAKMYLCGAIALSLTFAVGFGNSLISEE